MTNFAELTPDIKISINQIFGIDTEMKVDGFSKKNAYVPEIDSTYKFDRDTTLAIISGFAYNKRVLIQGYHGTGKSTHIEQVAARLNWPNNTASRWRPLSMKRLKRNYIPCAAR